MIHTQQPLAALLAGSPWADRTILDLPVPETDQVVFALEINPEEAAAAWYFAQGLLPQTGRWPLVTCGWGSGGDSWAAGILAADLLNRQTFVPPPGKGHRDPQTLIAAAEGFDLTSFGIPLDEHLYWGDPETVVAAALADTERRVGGAPTLADIQAALGVEHFSIPDLRRAERWLLDWEQQHFPATQPDRSHIHPFTPQAPTALLFLPIQRSWQALAYLPWFPAQYAATEPFIAQGMAWQQRFGAELWAHYGTMLHCHVARPPQTLDQAWELAQQQAQFAPCTLLLPGVSLRDHALALLNYGEWFLHERP